MMGSLHHRRSALLSFSALTLFVNLSVGAYVQFSNCLDPGFTKSDPRLLQFVPLNVTAIFDTANPTHNLNVTFYGNVTGQSVMGSYPPPNDPSWTNPNSSFGKIEDLVEGASRYTTLFGSFNVLSYTPYNAPSAQFCKQTTNQQCPLAPSFNVSRSDLQQLPAWSISHNMAAAYSFSEIIATTKVQSGAQLDNAYYYACINAYITPDIGSSLRALLRYLPAGILILVGAATISAAMFSPWGTWDIFRWTSNFGRDEDVLRLVTPGFGDCLQYLQFVVLTGSLSLNYPGFYQPVVSRIGWSSLLFNESFVSGGSGNNPIIDGIYQYRNASDSGMDRMTQLIGMTSSNDAWAGMMVWLAVIVAAVIVLTQIGFVMRWSYRKLTKVPPEDLRSKNWYFTVGNTIRVLVGFLILPIISLSMFQFAIAGESPIYTTVLAAIILVCIIAFAVRLVYMFARTRPRSYLFDDLQCVLAYGPLYNTYCDDAATFALIPILVNFLRGIAIGAVQASGVAQIVLLAISEIVFVLTINAFRPYPSATSMNLYHTCFSIFRLISVLLLVAFIPSLNVAGGSRGWIGYAVLLIHASVLVFGFLLNAVQTLIEVIARLAGAGGSGGSDAARGGLVKVFGVRQLAKRTARGEDVSRNSMSSHAAMFPAMEEPKDAHMLRARSRSRSVSASSTMLLDDNMRSPARNSQLYAGTSDGQITPDASSTFSMGHRQHRSGGSSGIVNLPPKQVEAKDPYYRPPRRNTVDLLRNEPRAPAASAGGTGRQALLSDPVEERGEGSSTPFRTEDFEESGNELTKTKTDYAVREVDFYYGVRGPALSSGTRKLKTGPADPTGPVSNATGWFKGLLGGRKKEKTKGFEVVRSARAPPGSLGRGEDFELDPEPSEPYRDLPNGSSQKLQTSRPRRLLDEDEDYNSESRPKTPKEPPLLPLIDTVGDIELPSRVGSEHSKIRPLKREAIDVEIPEVPVLPRRSSRRTSSVESAKLTGQRLSTVSGSAPATQSGNSTPPRLPFAPTGQLEPGIQRYTIGGPVFDDDQENQPPDTISSKPGGHHRQASSLLSEDLGDERPQSLGFVKEHRASDGLIHQSNSAASLKGRSAEIHNSHKS